MKEQVCHVRCPFSKYQQVEHLQMFLSVSKRFGRPAKEEQLFFVFCSCKTCIMVGDFFEEPICAANCSVVRRVSNMFSVGEVSLNIYMICVYQRLLILTHALNRVNQQLENSSVCTYCIAVLPRNALMIGHKVGKEVTTAVPLTSYPHGLSFQRMFSVALLLKCQ